MAADKSVSIDYWRKFFRSANTDLFQVIEKAILVAASDYPDEFAGRRDHIAHTLYTCRLDRCSGCGRTEQRALDGLKEDDDSDRGGEKEGKVLRSCDHPSASNEPEETIRIVSGHSYDDAEAITEEMEEESQIVGEVLRIKEILANQQDESEKVLFESLRRLQSMELSVDLLMATEIGKAVNCLRRHCSKQIRHLVRNLIEGWKVIVDEWMKATDAITDTPTDSINPSVVSEEHELPIPPVNGEDLLASQTTTTELSKFFEGMDKDGDPINNGEFEKMNVRNPQIENSLPVRKQESSEHEGPTRTQEEAVIVQPKPQEAVNRPPKPRITLKARAKTADTDSGHERPSKLALEQKASDDTESHHRQDSSDVPKKLPTSVQDPDESSVRVKLEIAKRKLHERYQQAENAKKQRTIRVLNVDDLPKQGRSEVQPNAKPRNHGRSLLNVRW